MEKTICVFGDSITWGASDLEYGGWVNRLWLFFANGDHKKDIFVDLYNLGVSGDNTSYLLERFDVEAEARWPNIIIFAVGINDSYYLGSESNPNVSLDVFEKNLEMLVDKACKHSHTEKVAFIGLTKVDESKTAPRLSDPNKFFTNKAITKYNQKIKDLCSQKNLPFIDMSGVLDDSDLEDGLHPNGNGHKKIFERVKGFLLENQVI